MKLLLTGGAGYIGGTAAHMLLQQGFELNILDDLSTGHAESVPKGANFFQGSLLDEQVVSTALRGCDAVMHFAAKSLVGESVEKPELYEKVNVGGSTMLFNKMRELDVRDLVFSSTAATYGEPKHIPITEEDPPEPTNPYGATKLKIDQMITEYGFNAISLRYFNVAGAYKSSAGWIQELHNPETHLIPNILKATDKNPIKIFGTDWPTKDGTCIRDYVHVVDLIDAHIKALNNLKSEKHEIINLGSGSGYSVREVIQTAAKVVGHEIPQVIGPRRSGDPAVLIAGIEKAKIVLDWQPKLNLEQMIRDSWSSMN